MFSSPVLAKEAAAWFKYRVASYSFEAAVRSCSSRSLDCRHCDCRWTVYRHGANTPTVGSVCTTTQHAHYHSFTQWVDLQSTVKLSTLIKVPHGGLLVTVTRFRSGGSVFKHQVPSQAILVGQTTGKSLKIVALRWAIPLKIPPTTQLHSCINCCSVRLFECSLHN